MPYFLKSLKRSVWYVVLINIMICIAAFCNYTTRPSHKASSMLKEQLNLLSNNIVRASAWKDSCLTSLFIFDMPLNNSFIFIFHLMTTVAGAGGRRFDPDRINQSKMVKWRSLYGAQDFGVSIPRLVSI